MRGFSPAHATRLGVKGDAPVAGWADFRKKGMFSGAKYSLKKGWGGKFATETKKFEFYSETAKKGLLEHAKKFNTSVDDILAVSGYVAKGEVAEAKRLEVVARWMGLEQHGRLDVAQSVCAASYRGENER